MYEELIDKLVHGLWRVLHFPAELNHFLLNSFCLTQVTHAQIHATPDSSSENSSNECMTKAQASQGAKYSTSQRYDGQSFVAIV